jgi:hypothetical protein
VDACDEDARTCPHAQAFIKRLNKIEKEVPIDKVSAKERERTRKEKSAPILAEFLGWLEENKDKHLPKSGVTGAIRYALNHWTELNAYVEDGNLPISNCPDPCIWRMTRRPSGGSRPCRELPTAPPPDQTSRGRSRR